MARRTRLQLDDVLDANDGSIVWSTRRRGCQGPFAVKRVQPVDPADRARVAARLAEVAGVEHPNLLTIFEVNEGVDGTTVVMQLAPGGSLADLLAERGPLDVGEAVAMAAPVADALDVAHGGDLVHGDVSPSNIVLDDDGSPLLTDFSDGGATDGYVAPEVAAGRVADARADVYSLAAVCRDVIDRAAATPDVREVLDRGLADDPDDRPATCTELVELLRACVPDGDVRLPGVATSRGAVVARTRPFGPRPAGPSAAIAPRWPKVVVAVVALVVAVLGWWAVRPGSGSLPRCGGDPVRAPAGAQLVEGDTSGLGCTSVGVYEDQVLTIRLRPTDPAPRRFALGRPGDRIVLGDWNCDGLATPAVERPATGEVFFHNRWDGTDVAVRQPSCGESIR